VGTDASNASNRAETDRICHGEGAGTYLGVRDPKHGVGVMDGLGSQTDTLSRHSDVPSVEMEC